MLASDLQESYRAALPSLCNPRPSPRFSQPLPQLASILMLDLLPQTETTIITAPQFAVHGRPDHVREAHVVDFVTNSRYATLFFCSSLLQSIKGYNRICCW